MPTPLPPIYDVFVLSGAGIAAANAAAAHGPLIDIASFKVGTGSAGATSADTGLNGTTVYSGVPTAWNRQSDGTVDIICVLPPTLSGYFQEIALYLADGTMFAHMTFTEPQTLFSGALSRNSYTIHCLLKLEQGTGLITSTIAAQQPQVSYTDKWSNVTPPSTYSTDTKFLIVQEPVNVEGTLGILTPSTTADTWVVVNAVAHDLVAAIFNDGASLMQGGLFSRAPYDSDYAPLSPTRAQTVVSWIGADGKQHFRLAHTEPNLVDFRSQIVPTVAITAAIAPPNGSNITVDTWEQNITQLNFLGAITGVATVGGNRSVNFTAAPGPSALGGLGMQYQHLVYGASDNNIGNPTTYTNSSGAPELLCVSISCNAGGGGQITGNVHTATGTVTSVIGHAAGSGGATSTSGQMTAIVPPGETVTIEGTLVNWLTAAVLRKA